VYFLKRLLKKDGNSLIWVLDLFTIVMIITTALFSVIFVATRTTTAQINTQQAYFSARAAVKATADYIRDNYLDDAAINKIISTGGSNIGTGSNTNMGSYNVTVTKINTGRLKISATATYNNVSRTVTAFLVKQLTASLPVVPTNSAFYINGTAATGIGQCNIYGDMYVNGSLTITQGALVRGTIFAYGNVSISGGATASCDALVCTGNLTLGGSGKVNGNALVGGDISASGNTSITGNANANGSLTNGGVTFYSNAIFGKNVTFTGGHINGNLTYYGTSTPTTPTSYVTGTITKKTTTYTPIDFSPYTPQVLSAFTRPTISSSAPTMVNKVISSSGTLTSSFFNGISYGSVITIYTTMQDIYLLIDGFSFAPGNGLSFEVNGTHNVFVYLKGNAQFNLGANEYFGMKSRGTNPQIFIIGDVSTTTQSITLSSNSELDACIYMPFGTFTAGGSALTTYKFVGSCTAKAYNVDSNVSIHYSPSVIDGTPLVALKTGQVSGSSNYVVESWSSQ